MNLFNYLMAKKGHNTSVRDDLFAYLLGKNSGSIIKIATGTEINITDVTQETIVNLKLEKESTQETTTGKNILNSRVISGTVNGITYSYDEETQIYTFNGTCTTDNTLINNVAKDVIDFTNGITTVSAHYVGGSTTGGKIQFLTSGYSGVSLDFTNISSAIPILSQTASSNYSSSLHNCRFKFENGYAFNNLKIKLMVANTIDTTYESYTGGIASPNPDYPQEIKTVKGNVGITISNGTNTRNYTIPLGDNEIVGKGINLDELIIDKNGHCWLNKKFNKIDSYNGETITTDYWSTTGGLDTGATVYYVLDTPQLIDLDYVSDIRLYIGTNNINNSDEMTMELEYY